MEPARGSTPPAAAPAERVEAADTIGAGVGTERKGGAGRSRDRRRRTSLGARLARTVGITLTIAAIGVAPLASGGVHRPSLIALMAAMALGLAGVTIGVAASGGRLRLGLPVVLPVVLLLIPVLQSIPIPLGARSLLDPR